LAKTAARLDVPLIHVSTDYVFAGDGKRPYRETDPVAPLGVYGQSKRAGEDAIRAAHPKHLILRTAWVHSPWGNNFVKTMLRLGGEREELRIVGDQTGTPSYAPDLAGAIIEIAAQIASASADDLRWGTYHLTNSGMTTWYDFAAEIFSEVARTGRATPKLVRIPTADYPTPAQRPTWSVLDNARIGTVFGVQMRDWKVAARECVARLLEG
jgi:dTDP-4-dehydrorhamnose reductase